MEGGSDYDDLLHLFDSVDHSHWVPSVSFNDITTKSKRGHQDGPSGKASEGECNVGEELATDQSGKRRRLTTEQVEFLEKSIEEENRLDLNRRDKLASEIGLQSKQVAIWFQNRRASNKTKRINTELTSVKIRYDRLQCDNDALTMQCEELENENEILKKKVVVMVNNLNPINEVVEEGIPTMESVERVGKTGLGETVMEGNYQAKDVNSTKIPHYNDNNTSTLNVTSSPSVFVLDQLLDLSPEDEEHFMMNKNLLHPETPPTLNNIFNDANDGNYGPSCY